MKLRIGWCVAIVAILFANAAFGAQLETWEGKVVKGRVTYARGTFHVANKDGESEFALDKVFEIRSPRIVTGREVAGGSIVLTDRSKITGRIMPFSSTDKISLKCGADNHLELAGEMVHSFILNPLDAGAQIAKVKEKSYIVMVTGQVIACEIEWMTYMELGIKSEAGRLRLACDKIHKVVFGREYKKGAADATVFLKTYRGDSVRGALTSLDKDFAVLKHAAGVLKFPSRELYAIEVLSSRVVSLLDLPMKEKKEVPYFDFIRPHQVNRSLFGGPLQIRGVPFDRGFAVHSRTTFVYALEGKYKRFVATVGLDTAISDGGRGEFIVSADGNELLRIPMSGLSNPQQISLDLKEARSLTLIFDFGENGSSGDYGVWGHPRLIK